MTTTLNLPPERLGRAPLLELVKQRAQFAAAVMADVWKTDRPPLQTTLAGCRVLCFRPENKPQGRVLHFHGGGFRNGGPEFVGRFAEALARRCNVEVWVPQYRLAPEHPFPAALIDAFACLEALHESAKTTMPFIVSGDSAGGGLAASLCALNSNSNNAVMIDGVVLISPWLDLTASARSYAVNAASDPLFSKSAADDAADLYLQGFDKKHPLVSPLHADLAAYPPTLINVGSGEVLLDDSLRFHDMLQAHQLHSILHVVEDMQHIGVIRSMELTGASEAFTRIATFMNNIVSQAGKHSE